MLAVKVCVPNYVAGTSARLYINAMEYGAVQTGRTTRIIRTYIAAE